MYENHFRTIGKLTDVLEKINGNAYNEVKRANGFMKWIMAKLNYFESEEQPLVISEDLFKKKINEKEYNYFHSDIRLILDTYYGLANNKCRYRNSVSMTQSDKEFLLRKIVLRPGNVVWVDFGFNIGKEFGGKHPAIIMKNLGDNLIVCPVSTFTISLPKRSGVLEIDKIYNFPLRNRFTDVTRMTPVSIYRIDFTDYGSISDIKFKELKMKIQSEWK